MPTLGHAEMPYPKGTLVEDKISHRTGELMGVLEERTEEGQLIKREAYVRPEGGGMEWEVPLAQIKLVRDGS
ncbi:hypothetical protein [Streptomyces sp. NBC_01750]|uniref:hypothetical protein n=1 Tax=Streptomyces sp. NBC_01750 TaxID=2975928 RepID=UPI002DDC1A64|nr:hypothetical protein [Streptomyces sp. NBC_01750]WSD33345.1 hypothetical protein OG966_16390 [Streptomyces sp. NBC_01750]